MRITLLANAGLYIEIEDRRFLLDAIHYDEAYVFSRLPKNLCWDMLHGVGKYTAFTLSSGSFYSERAYKLYK